jgi:hypothetical protein
LAKCVASYLVFIPLDVARVSVTPPDVGVRVSVGATALPIILRVAVDAGSGMLSVMIVLVILSTVN